MALVLYQTDKCYSVSLESNYEKHKNNKCTRFDLECLFLSGTTPFYHGDILARVS